MDRERRSQDAPSGNKRSAVVALYDMAWDRYGARCLWYLRRAEVPDVHDVEETARALRVNGDLPACLLADRLREADRAA
jgi:hypothetical protein